MVIKIRARREEDKLERRRAILQAAERLAATVPFGEVKMADVARRARIAKGTVFLYFPTKEALFLALLQDGLGAWMDELDAGLEARAEWTGEALAQALAASLVGREGLLRVLVLLETLLERNVTAEDIEGFKRWLLARLERTGARLELRLAGLPRGSGVRFLLLLNALVVGLWQMADHAPLTREVLARPGLQAFQLDFARELQAAVTTLLRGLAAGPKVSLDTKKRRKR